MPSGYDLLNETTGIWVDWNMQVAEKRTGMHVAEERTEMHVAEVRTVMRVAGARLRALLMEDNNS